MARNGKHRSPWEATASLDYDKKVFNYRLCRARRLIENAVGTLSQRVRLFLTAIECKVSTVDLIVKACCALHNYLIDRNCPPPAGDGTTLRP